MDHDEAEEVFGAEPYCQIGSSIQCPEQNFCLHPKTKNARVSNLYVLRSYLRSGLFCIILWRGPQKGLGGSPFLTMRVVKKSKIFLTLTIPVLLANGLAISKKRLWYPAQVSWFPNTGIAAAGSHHYQHLAFSHTWCDWFGAFQSEIRCLLSVAKRLCARCSIPCFCNGIHVSCTPAVPIRLGMSNLDFTGSI